MNNKWRAVIGIISAAATVYLGYQGYNAYNIYTYTNIISPIGSLFFKYGYFMLWGIALFTLIITITCIVAIIKNRK